MSIQKTYKKVTEISGIEVGRLAPDFIASDAFGNQISLSGQLQNGPVLLIFIRGQWCPFCNAHLKNIQKNIKAINEKGASVLVVSPELSPFLKKTIEKTGAEFSILSDPDQSISEAYGVLFKPKKLEAMMYNFLLGANMKKSHAHDQELLPVPATYIISKEGRIVWRHFEPDYKKRSAIKDILNNVPV